MLSFFLLCLTITPCSIRGPWVSSQSSQGLSFPSKSFQGKPFQGKPFQGTSSKRVQKKNPFARFVRAACRRNPLIRVQAARRLRGSGKAGWEAISAFIDKNGLGSLSAELVLSLGKLGSPRALAWLRRTHEKPDFPWPPQALRALAEAVPPGNEKRRDTPLFRRKLEDRSASIRLAALLGLAKTEEKEALPILRSHLGDPSPAVRIGAAKILIQAGDPLGLPILVESLNLRDRVLDLDLAAAPRMEARRLLRRFLQDPKRGPLPRDPKTFATFAEKRIRKLLRRQYRLPSIARGVSPEPSFVFLAERRSCRTGDFILRIDAEGFVWTGESPPRKAVGLDGKKILDGKKLLQLFREIPKTPLGRAAKIRCDYLRIAWDKGKRVRRAPGDFPPTWTPFFALLHQWEKALQNR